MSWKSLLAGKDAQTHKTSKQELEKMRALVERDLKDAAVAAVSADRRFATAYNAAAQAANMVIACQGYRITAKTGHHKLTLEYAGLTIGKGAANLISYFETCRRKRNQIDYTMSHGKPTRKRSWPEPQSSWSSPKSGSRRTFPA